VAAAKAALQLVETHGLLDEALDAVRGLDPEAAAGAVQSWYAVASRLPRHAGARFVATGVHGDVEQGYVCLDRSTCLTAVNAASPTACSGSGATSPAA
jgi:hypothetical protein